MLLLSAVLFTVVLDPRHGADIAPAAAAHEIDFLLILFVQLVIRNEFITHLLHLP